MNTKTALLDSAERAARQYGYDGFSYADLAKEVGIRKASVHYHFPAKADLALALMTRYRLRSFEALAAMDAKWPRAADRLRAYIKFYRQALSGGNAVCLCVSFGLAREHLSPAVLAQMSAFHDDSIKWLYALFAQAQQDGSIRRLDDPSLEAAACLALVEGGQLIARAAKDLSHFDRALAQLTSRLS